MMRPASSRKQASKKHYPVVGFPSGQREQTVNLPSSTSKVRILPPPPSLSTTSKFELPLVGFPSGQREQTVNLPSSTSKVRILPPPPSLLNNPKIIIKLNRIRCCRPGKAQPPPGDRSQKPTSAANVASPANFSQSTYYTGHALPDRPATYPTALSIAPPA